MTRRDDNDHAVEVSVQELLKEANQAELDSREGQWSAFTSAVFRRIDSEDLGVARMPLEEQAIESLKSEVDRELQTMAPRFEEDFLEGIEKRVWRSARREPSFGTWLQDLWARVVSLVAGAPGAGVGRKLGFAAAMAAVAMLTIVGVRQEELAPLERSAGAGLVSLESVSFEGTVAVIPQDGLTVVWLSDVGA